MAAISPYKRDLPFIHRAWKTAVDHLPKSMGIKLSTANGDTSANEDNSPRAAKRRRVAEDSPEAARAVPGRLLPDVPDDIEKALRIEILSITRVGKSIRGPNSLHYGNGSPQKKEIPAIKARCRVLIYEWRQPEPYRVLYSDSQICNFKAFHESGDACQAARIYLPIPFLISAEKLFVERYDERGFHLADEYLVRIEIESAGDTKWPPMDLLPKREAHGLQSGDPRRWILSAQVVYAFEKGRSTGLMKIKKKNEEIPLDLSIDMDLRWSVRHVAGSSARCEDPAFSPNDVDRVPGPFINGHVNGNGQDAPNAYQKAENGKNGSSVGDEEREEVATSGRSLRARGSKNYNLKLLSDIARGREQKDKKQRKLGSLESHSERKIERKDGSVTWAVPLVGEFTLESYDCIRCFATHSSIHQLQKHMEVHTDILYTVDLHQAYIRIFAPDEEALRSLNSTFRRLSSLEDQESDGEINTPPRKLPKKSTQQKNKTFQSLPTKPQDNRRLIPHIKHPLYDRISKSLLEPGSLVDPPPVDDSWLVQKHRDIIRDYTDVHQDEKEYITEWDSFVNRDYVTTEPHLQDVYIKFIQDRASWITESQNRITEWAKHLCYLKSRNALTDKTVTEAFTVMRQARSQSQPEQVEATQPPPTMTAYRTSVAGCPVCGQPVRSPTALICSNVDCSNAIYHIKCIRPLAKQDVDSRNWHCNVCHDAPKAAS